MLKNKFKLLIIGAALLSSTLALADDQYTYNLVLQNMKNDSIDYHLLCTPPNSKDATDVKGDQTISYTPPTQPVPCPQISLTIIYNNKIIYPTSSSYVVPGKANAIEVMTFDADKARANQDPLTYSPNQPIPPGSTSPSR